MPDPVVNPPAPPNPSVSPPDTRFAGKYADDAAALRGVNEIRKQIGLEELAADKPLYGEGGHFRDRSEAEGRYKEHEKVFHATRRPAAAPSDLGIKADDKTVIEDEPPETVLEKAGITPEDAAKALANGALTPEQIAKIRQTTPSYKNLSDAKINLIAKGHYADEQARASKRAEFYAKGTAIVGSEEAHNAVREWAKANLSADELKDWADTVKAKPGMYPAMIRDIHARYQEAIGAGKTKPLVHGSANAPGGIPTNRAEFAALQKRINSGDVSAHAVLARMSLEQINALGA